MTKAAGKMKCEESEVEIDPLLSMPQMKQSTSSSPPKSTTKVTIATIQEEKIIPLQHDAPPPKDTGIAAYSVLAAVTCIESAVLAPTICYGIFQNFYSETFPNNKIASWIGVLMSALAFLLSPAMTWLCQKYSIRRETYVICGITTCACSFLMAAFMNTLPGLIMTQGLMFGIGSAFVDLPSLTVLNSWFDSRRGFSYGVVFAGVDLVGAAYCFLAQYLLTTLTRRDTMLVMATLIAGVAGPAWFFLRERIDAVGISSRLPDEKSPASSIDLQYVVHEETQPLNDELPRGPLARRSSSLDEPKPPVLVSTNTFELPMIQEQKNGWPALQPSRRYYHRALFYVFTAANFLQSFAYYLPFIYLPTYATHLGLSRSQGTIILAVANLAQVIGDLGFGKLSDKVHVKYLVVTTTGVSSCSTFLLWGLSKPSSGSEPFVVLVTYGLVFGTFGAGFLSLWARIGALFGERDSEMIYGTMCAGRGVATILSGPVSQALISSGAAADYRKLGHGPFAGMIFFVGICNGLAAFMGLSAVVALHARKLKRGVSQAEQETLTGKPANAMIQ